MGKTVFLQRFFIQAKLFAGFDIAFGYSRFRRERALTCVLTFSQDACRFGVILLHKTTVFARFLCQELASIFFFDEVFRRVPHRQRNESFFLQCGGQTIRLTGKPLATVSVEGSRPIGIFEAAAFSALHT